MARRAFENIKKARENRRREEQGLPPLSTNNRPGASQSHTQPAIATSTPAPTNDGNSVDLMNLSCVERKQLAQGGMVTIFIGNKSVWTLHRNLLIATSTKGSSVIHDQKVILPTDCSEPSVIHLMKWITNATRYNDIRELRFVYKLSEAIALKKAADELGMTKYIVNILNFHRKEIIKKVPTQDELTMVENSATDSTDVFVQMMAERIGFLVRHDALHQDFDFMWMMDNAPKIHDAYRTCNAAWIDRQAAREEEARVKKEQRAEQRRKQKERKAHKLSDKQLQEQREARKKEVDKWRAHLLPKVNMKLISLTAEEREWALWFKNYKKDPAFSMVV